MVHRLRSEGISPSLPEETNKVYRNWDGVQGKSERGTPGGRWELNQYHSLKSAAQLGADGDRDENVGTKMSVQDCSAGAGNLSGAAVTILCISYIGILG